MKIDQLIALAAEQPTRVSRRSGVSRSTLKRVGDGTSEPTLSTLREVALALGLDVRVSAAAASDPHAAAAARTLIDDSVPEDPGDAEVRAWLERFGRWGINDPLTLVAEAGVLQGLTVRPGARFLNARPGALAELPRLLAGGGAQWALSGAAAVTVIRGELVAGPTVLWHSGLRGDQLGALGAELGEETGDAATADLIIVPAGATELVGATPQGPLNFVAPVQLVIDLHSLRMYREAEFLTAGWR